MGISEFFLEPSKAVDMDCYQPTTQGGR